MAGNAPNFDIRLSALWNGKSANLERRQASSFEESCTPDTLIYTTFDMGLNLTSRYALHHYRAVESGISFHTGPHCAWLHGGHLHMTKH